MLIASHPAAGALSPRSTQRVMVDRPLAWTSGRLPPGQPLLASSPLASPPPSGQALGDGADRVHLFSEFQVHRGGRSMLDVQLRAFELLLAQPHVWDRRTPPGREHAAEGQWMCDCVGGLLQTCRSGSRRHIG